MEKLPWRKAQVRAGALAGQLAQVQADLLELTVELLDSDWWRGGGYRSPQHWLEVYTGVSSAQAKHLITIAERAEEMPTVRKYMAEGRLTLDQAAPIAEKVPAYAEPRATRFAELATVSQVRRVMRSYCFDPVHKPAQPDEPETPEVPDTPPLPEPKPTLTMLRLGERFRLTFESNATDGALIEEALKEAKDALFTAGQEKATYVDALLEVASRSLDSVSSPSRRDHYKVLIHLDTRGRGWLNKQGVLPPRMLEQFTCDGKVRPVWETDGVPVSVGRSQRIVPARTRKLIEDRDKGCRFPGCSVTRFLENHHLVHWSRGGETNIESLVSLCPYHHREHHRGAFTMRGDPTTPDGLKFFDENGRRIGKVLPLDGVTFPDRPPPVREGPRGESYEAASVDFGIPPPGFSSF